MLAFAESRGSCSPIWIRSYDREGQPGASVAARLLRRAKELNDDYQNVLTSYCFERFLFRLGVSDLRDRFVLKGAMLLRLWSSQPYRATRDLDLLRRGEGTFDAIREDLRTICVVSVPPDGVIFDGDHIEIESIRAEDEYAGARGSLTARCNTARLILRIDMGLGDAVWPPAEVRAYPALLEFPAPEIFAYPREAVVAEKFEAMVTIGDRNSRIKDFFDLSYLASHFEFDRATLSEAVRRTFARRHTLVPPQDPIGLTPLYWQNPSRPAQIRAFARRAAIELPSLPEENLPRLLHEFLGPLLDDLRREKIQNGTWSPGGPWR